MTKNILYVQKLITYHTLQALLDKLSSEDFVRIHKSYVVQISRITSLEGNMIHINNDILPVGRNYKNDLLSLINQMSDR